MKMKISEDLSIKEAAFELCVSRTTIRRLMEAKQLRYYIIGSSYRITKESMDKYIKYLENSLKFTG